MRLSAQDNFSRCFTVVKTTRALGKASRACCSHDLDGDKAVRVLPCSKYSLQFKPWEVREAVHGLVEAAPVPDPSSGIAQTVHLRISAAASE